jgi:hypothetical protein
MQNTLLLSSGRALNGVILLPEPMHETLVSGFHENKYKYIEYILHMQVQTRSLR